VAELVLHLWAEDPSSSSRIHALISGRVLQKSSKIVL
jgi:hypothetical protein